MRPGGADLPGDGTFEAQTSGSAAAPRGDGTDTPTGVRLPGQPSLVTHCFRCQLSAPFPQRSPCPRCEFDPHGTRGVGHPVLSAVWVSHAVWWNPRTWGTGHWHHLEVEEEERRLKFSLAAVVARHHRAVEVLIECDAEERAIRARLDSIRELS